LRYRTRLLIFFSATAILASGLSIAVVYERSRQYLLEEFRAKVESIAATVGSLLDGDLHKTIQARSDETSTAYLKLQQQLRRARDANRRPDTYINYLFTIYPAVQDPSVIEIGVDPEESLENAAHAGDVYHSSRGKSIKIEQVQVDQDFSTDQWGTWLSANAPIQDSSGKVVAAVTAEFSADRVHQKLKPVLYGGLLALGLAISLSVGGALLLSWQVSRPLEALRCAVEEIGKGRLEARVNLERRDEFGVVARAVNDMAAGLQERETVKTAFARYVSRQVMDGILHSGALPELRGDRRRITVLFCDIRGFSTFSENMRPEEVVQLLNEYFERMVEVVFRNQGTLDKFIGDGLMVIFGAPQEDPYQEEHAIKAALEMQQELRVLCQKWETEGRMPIRVGIGINSGTAIVGNIGSSQRMEYTAIGDTVNLAARLESATKELEAAIVISEFTYNAVKGAFKTKNMGQIQVKGRSEPVRVHAVEG
jgi:adenylate cyclase